MINLLPTEYKQGLMKMYHLRLVTTILVFLFFLVVIAGAFLLPSYILSSIKEKNISARLATLQKGESFDVSKNMNLTIEDINKKVSLFRGALPDPLLSADVLIPISNRIPKGISISGISYNSDAQGALITIHGKASGRKSLELFVANLETYKRFSKVNFPISDFVRNKDIDFDITCNFI